MDDYSRYYVSRLLRTRTKKEVTKALVEIVEQLESMMNLRTHQIQGDWEFRNQILDTYCQKKGIVQKETMPNHSETHAAIERAIRTIVTMARTILIDSKLPKNM